MGAPVAVTQGPGGSDPPRVSVSPLSPQMKVPTDLALLPGHIFQLSEALREEQDRRATLGSPATPGSAVTSGPPEPPLPL